MAVLDDIAFLARSPHRMAVLEALVDGSYTRAELQAETGVPRATVGRIVTELESRRLITEHGSTYRLSSLGALLAEEFLSLVETAAVVEKLRPVIGWLPIETFDFDLERFADAEITVAGPGDVIAPVRRAIESFDGGEYVRLLGPEYVREGLRAIREATVQGDQRIEMVLTTDIVAAITDDPEAAEWLREIAAADHGTVFRYDGTIPHIVTIIDERVWFGLSDENRTPRGLLETTDETIHSWAERTFETHREAAVRVDADDLADR